MNIWPFILETLKLKYKYKGGEIIEGHNGDHEGRPANVFNPEIKI